MYNFLLTMIIACAFGYLFLKFKVPGGMMVGSIVAISILSITTGRAYIPSIGRVVAQIIAGAFIGVSVEKSDLTRLKFIFKPAALLITGMLILNIISGFLIYKFSSLDLMTSLMSAVPGGISDIPIVSAEMGADASKVVVMQFIRLLVGIGIFPAMIAKITEGKGNKQYQDDEVYKRVKSESNDMKSFIMTSVTAGFLGVIGRFTGIPAGAIIFSMSSVIILKLSTEKACMPRWMKRLAQVLAGAYIGSSIQYTDVMEVKSLFVPSIILILGYLFACISIGSLMHKKFNLSIREAMLAATPAGASDMALIAADIGVESADVIVLQIIRLVTVVSIFPQVVHLIVKVLG